MSGFFEDSDDDILDSKIFTFTGQSDRQSRMKSSITGKEQLKLIAVYVAAPGAVGGLAKAAQEALDPNMTGSAVRAVSILPAYSFLGAVAAVLTVAFISDSIKKTHLKLVAISLACGLVFPTVLSSSNSIIRLQSELQTLEREKTDQTYQTVATISDFASNSQDIDTQLESISRLRDLARGTENLEIIELVLFSLQQATGSMSPIAKAKAIEAMEEIGQYRDRLQTN